MQFFFNSMVGGHLGILLKTMLLRRLDEKGRWQSFIYGERLYSGRAEREWRDQQYWTSITKTEKYSTKCQKVKRVLNYLLSDFEIDVRFTV